MPSQMHDELEGNLKVHGYCVLYKLHKRYHLFGARTAEGATEALNARMAEVQQQIFDRENHMEPFRPSIFAGALVDGHEVPKSSSNLKCKSGQV